jgi:hypothetical protein
MAEKRGTKTKRSSTSNNKKKEDTTKRHKAKMLEALEKTNGVVSRASRIAKIDRSTHYDWTNPNSSRYDPDYHNAVDEIQDFALDEVEDALFSQIKDGSTAATIFYLKTKGKKRGYIERQEIHTTSKDPDLSQLTTDEIKDLLKDDE